MNRRGQLIVLTAQNNAKFSFRTVQKITYLPSAQLAEPLKRGKMSRSSRTRKKPCCRKLTEVRPMLNMLSKCFIKLVAMLSDEVLDRWHQVIEVERYRRALNQRQPIDLRHQARRLSRGATPH